jgi:uncharacterized cupredoxin-like copper-binding protein
MRVKGGIYLVLCGLAALLAGLLLSCEKEEGLKEKGEMVMVNISLGGVLYNGNEMVTRGYAEEGETVTVALGEGLFMYTRIEKNRVAEMRAGGEALEDGVKVRVVAYQGGTIKGTGEYTVQSGVLVSSNGSGFAVEEGEYTFVAYSYNSTTSPDHSAAVVTVASPNDLLWGSKLEDVNAMNNEVTITMKHKFAQVRVKATIDDVDITNIDGVTVSPGNSADLTVETGNLVKNGAAVAAAVPISWGEWSDGEEVTSEPVVIYTGMNNIIVNIGSITIDGYDEPFTNAKAVFNKALEEGYSYTLVISFQRTRWAKSNIYWDGQKLTFDTYENSHQGYQGVYFKWGSLIGISPAQGAGSTENEKDAFSGDTPMYVPIVNSPLENSSWKATTGSEMAADEDFPTVEINWDAWESTTSGAATSASNIPYMDGRYAKTGTSYGVDNTYVMDDALNLDTAYQGFRGDICRYLSTKTKVVKGDWRLPKASDFGAASDWTMVNGYSSNTAWGHVWGMVDLLSITNMGRITNAGEGDVVLPAAGYRVDGTLRYVGRNCDYWSGSASDATRGYVLRFYENSSTTATEYDRGRYGFSVRCVRN